MPTEPDDKTTAEDERDAQAAHDADRPPTEDEEEAADRHSSLDPASAEAYKDAIERGAAIEGEGQIDL
jgi:hypothetical protein